MNDKDRRRMNYGWELVETFDDGTELVRHTGSYAVCAGILLEMRAVGFTRVRIQRAKEEGGGDDS
jgi:hypothetical protein